MIPDQIHINVANRKEWANVVHTLLINGYVYGQYRKRSVYDVGEHYQSGYGEKYWKEYVKVGYGENCKAIINSTGYCASFDECISYIEFIKLMGDKFKSYD